MENTLANQTLQVIFICLPFKVYSAVNLGTELESLGGTFMFLTLHDETKFSFGTLVLLLCLRLFQLNDNLLG